MGPEEYAIRARRVRASSVSTNIVRDNPPESYNIRVSHASDGSVLSAAEVSSSSVTIDTTEMHKAYSALHHAHYASRSSTQPNPVSSGGSGKTGGTVQI